jgi:hypothetical protein
MDYKMKKLAAIIAVAAIAASATFATTSTSNYVKLKSDVAETAVVLNLYYGSNSTLISKTEGTLTDISVGDISTVSSTDVFTLKGTGNLKEQATYNTTVTATNFLQDANNNADTGINVNIAYEDTYSANFTFPAGYHKGTAVTLWQFKLKWTPKKTLAAGSYHSNVTVTYTTN